MARDNMKPRTLGNGWTFDPRQRVYKAPDGRYLAQRETNGRWSLWWLPDGVDAAQAKATSFELVWDRYHTLMDTILAAEQGERPER